jgi:hypothetical protein
MESIPTHVLELNPGSWRSSLILSRWVNIPVLSLSLSLSLFVEDDDHSEWETPFLLLAKVPTSFFHWSCWHVDNNSWRLISHTNAALQEDLPTLHSAAMVYRIVRYTVDSHYPPWSLKWLAALMLLLPLPLLVLVIGDHCCCLNIMSTSWALWCFDIFASIYK